MIFFWGVWGILFASVFILQSTSQSDECLRVTHLNAFGFKVNPEFASRPKNVWFASKVFYKFLCGRAGFSIKNLCKSLLGGASACLA